MIVDSFILCNELDLLEARLEYLYNSVDKFVVVEADTKFNGSKRELTHFNSLNRFNKYLDKIIYSPVSVDTGDLCFDVSIDSYNPDIPHWKIEAQVRNSITLTLPVFHNSTCVMLSDIDEIPRIEAFRVAARNLSRKVPYLVLKQQMFYYNFERVQVDPWFGTIVTTARSFREVGAQPLREQRNSIPHVTEGGWHLSCWMTPEEISEKIKSFSHQEFNKEEYTDTNNIIKNLKETGDYLGRGYNKFNTFDINNLPEDFRTIITKYTGKGA